jgi:cell division protein FtsA
MKTAHKKKALTKGEIFAALDVGTNKISCAIAMVDEKEKLGLTLLGHGQNGAKGIKNGAVVDMDALEDSILNAVHAAEQAASKTISSLYVSLPTIAIRSEHVEAEITLENEEVNDNHLRHLLSLGKHAQEFNQCQIIHALPLSYSLDDQHGIKDPRGMFGKNLKAQMHILAAPYSIIKNISTCIGRCHLDVKSFVVSAYASGLSTLVDDELELGVTVIDIGGGTTTVSSFINGSLVHLFSIPIGGMHITNDLARGLSTPLNQAERLKTLYGSVFPINLDDKEHIIVPQLGDFDSSITNQVPKSFFMHIIKARVEEIFDYILKNLQKSGWENLVNQRIVLTGGSSMLPGLVEFVGALWQKPVRLGYPYGFHQNNEMTQNPMFATCVGLLHYAWRDERSREVPLPTPKGQLWQRFIGWFKENF